MATISDVTIPPPLLSALGEGGRGVRARAGGGEG
jgi:hypothetical protein